MLPAILIAVAAVGLAVVLALGILLIRQLVQMTGTLRRLQEDLVPALRAIQAEAEETRTRLERMREAQADDRLGG